MLLTQKQGYTTGQIDQTIKKKPKANKKNKNIMHDWHAGS